MVFKEKMEKKGVLEAAMARTSQDQAPVRAVLLLSSVTGGSLLRLHLSWVDQDPNRWFSHGVSYMQLVIWYKMILNNRFSCPD